MRHIIMKILKDRKKGLRSQFSRVLAELNFFSEPIHIQALEEHLANQCTVNGPIIWGIHEIVVVK